MKFRFNIVLLLRYLWLALAAVLIIVIISRAVSVKRMVVYNLDFSQSVSSDIVGWYPESRISYLSSLDHEAVDLLAEPVYLKVYTAGSFATMALSGSIINYDLYPKHDIRLGLKQTDGSWYFQEINNQDFSLVFDLAKARKYRNQLELILSVPSMVNGEKLILLNNWQIVLTR